jgi:hypothetical protein
MNYKLIIIVIILFFGCTNPFAPKLVNENLLSSSFLTNQKSPQDVLTNFRYAYVFKDSLIYSELIDSSFSFISTNYSTTPPIPINWGRDDDLRTTAKMFRHFRDINLTWGDTLSSKIDSIDAELKLIFTLTFDNGSEIPTLKGISLFNFEKKKTGKWQIVRWEDLSSF